MTKLITLFCFKNLFRVYEYNILNTGEEMKIKFKSQPFQERLFFYFRLF